MKNVDSVTVFQQVNDVRQEMEEMKKQHQEQSRIIMDAIEKLREEDVKGRQDEPTGDVPRRYNDVVAASSGNPPRPRNELGNSP